MQKEKLKHHCYKTFIGNASVVFDESITFQSITIFAIVQ